MKLCFWIGIVVLGALAVACRQEAKNSVATANSSKTNLNTFAGRGIVMELKPDGKSVVIAHEAISNYMDAMTMPFNVRQPKELAGLSAGDEITFRLRVTEDESWIDQIAKTGRRVTVETATNVPPAKSIQSASSQHPLLDYKFTNELGQSVSLNQFNGQALAVTFFFTRCPIPEFCPRLSKNFEEASQKLSAMPDAPTNWHFISVSFDPTFDTPEVLKAYAERYHYDPKHWSFLTGPMDKIAELAQSSNVSAKPSGNFFDHNFRTLIIDTKGELQMTFPVSGNLSDAIVAEILKAAAVTNK